MARRVRTQAGAAYYGVPIGHLITPDQEDDATARHAGRPAPPGALTGSNQKRAGQATVDKQKAGKKLEPAPSPSDGKRGKEEEKTATYGIQKPTISGPVPVLVGKEKFSAPEGSVVYKSPANPGRVYVVTPEGAAHVLTSHGEVSLTPEQQKALAAQVRDKFTPVTKETDEEDPEEVTWIRLVSMVRQIEQALRVGDESEAKRLILAFREAANGYNPEADPREVRTRVKKAAGVE